MPAKQELNKHSLDFLCIMEAGKHNAHTHTHIPSSQHYRTTQSNIRLFTLTFRENNTEKPQPTVACICFKDLTYSLWLYFCIPTVLLLYSYMKNLVVNSIYLFPLPVRPSIPLTPSYSLLFTVYLRRLRYTCTSTTVILPDNPKQTHHPHAQLLLITHIYTHAQI